MTAGVTPAGADLTHLTSSGHRVGRQRPDGVSPRREEVTEQVSTSLVFCSMLWKVTNDIDASMERMEPYGEAYCAVPEADLVICAAAYIPSREES